MVDFGAEDSFALASERLLRHHGIELNQSKLRRITLAHGKLIYEDKQMNTLDGVLPGEGSERMIAQADGTMLPVVEVEETEGDRRKSRSVKWEETKLCAAVA